MDYLGEVGPELQGGNKVSWEKIKLQVSDEVKQKLEDRHILEDDVKQVIHQAESEGEKLYEPDANRYLAKLRIGKATFYVEYSIEPESYAVRSAYAHKSEIVG
jgi:glutamate synthase (NADPH/NADH) small chain